MNTTTTAQAAELIRQGKADEVFEQAKQSFMSVLGVSRECAYRMALKFMRTVEAQMECAN